MSGCDTTTSTAPLATTDTAPTPATNSTAPMAATSTAPPPATTACGRNAQRVVCPHCPTTVLLPAAAALCTAPHPLPRPAHTRDTEAKEHEQVSAWWQVDDMFTFENIGFSNTVAQSKYLVCANCERGPLGYHDLDTKRSYVAVCRVHHRQD